MASRAARLGALSSHLLEQALCAPDHESHLCRLLKLEGYRGNDAMVVQDDTVIVVTAVEGGQEPIVCIKQQHLTAPEPEGGDIDDIGSRIRRHVPKIYG